MSSRINPFPLPNICRNSNLFIVVVLVQLAAMVIALVQYQQSFLLVLGGASLYMQWFALSSMALLCGLRAVIARHSFWKGAGLILAVLFIAFCFVEFGYQRWVLASQINGVNWDRFYAYSMAALIFIMILLRAMVLMARLESWHQSEAHSRIQALQAKIQPHFLFNSLNTISELTATRPDHAEKAIQSLSMLFRVSLEDGSDFHSLEAELALCKRYVSLEHWRVGQRVTIKQKIRVESTEVYAVPKLLLQPLVENAVRHSAENARHDKKGLVKISVRESPQAISMLVSNSTGDVKPQGGNGMAIDNIKQRLFMLYDDAHSFRIREREKEFQVIMQIPKQEIT
jgi:two-component system sensor histidine kinase AlgZ